MPSFTFVSTANAFVLRGAVPVFVDIRPDTLNIDESLIEAAITPRTKAIVVVHYAGVGCEMDAIMAIAARHGLVVIEDAAQGVMATYKGRALGSIGHLGCLSASTRRRTSSAARAARCWSTTRASRSGPRSSGRRAPTAASSSAARSTSTPGSTSARRTCPSELNAAFLWAQLRGRGRDHREAHGDLWAPTTRAFAGHEARGCVRRPVVPGRMPPQRPPVLLAAAYAWSGGAPSSRA